MTMQDHGLLPYAQSLAGTLLAAREAVMAPIRPVLRAARLTDQQWRVLRVLSDSGELDPTRLAHQALLHPPSVSRILRELRERKLIIRTGDQADGRRSVVTITPLGEELVTSTAQHTRRMLDIYESRFGIDRMAHLREELAALAAAIDDCSPEAEAFEESA